MAARYDAVPYRNGAILHSHPARLGAIGRLHGIKAAPPDRCRVLELGCGEGMNLLPLAERFPHSEFVGLDLSATQIATGEAAREACGLGNARLECVDLREWEPESEAFDYIIAHGLYSWVPAPVQERVLAIFARALRPQGLGYISYNTLPGWGLPGAVRTFLQEEIRTFSGADELTEARKILGALGQAMTGQAGGYAMHLQGTIRDMLDKPPELFFHDELEPVNDPCSFTTFVERAGRHQLHYVSEAHYATMAFEHAPASMRAALAGLNLDFLRQQQYMDVLFQRWLRNSLVSRANVTTERPVTAQAIRDCAIGLRLQYTGPGIDLREGVPMRLARVDGVAMEFTVEGEKAVLAALLAAAPQRVEFSAVLAAANTHLRSAGLETIRDEEAVCAMVHRLLKVDGIDLLLTGGGEWLATRDQPEPSALMRYEATRGSTITNRWHEPVGITPEGQRWIIESKGEENAAALAAGFLV